MIEILRKETLTGIQKKQIVTVFQELSPNKVPQDLDAILESENVVMLGCFMNGQLLGVASMAIYTVLSGHKGWIEDVVVSAHARGAGLGRKLIDKLISVARERKLTQVLLFTESHRTAAIGLYQSYGFVQKDTNVYSLKL